MYPDYFKEEFGLDTIENEHGFIMYELAGEECYLAHMFVRPESRKTFAGKKLFTLLTKVAKNNNCKFISTWVSTGPARIEKSTKLLRCHTALGFNIHGVKGNDVLLAYPLEGK